MHGQLSAEAPRPVRPLFPGSSLACWLIILAIFGRMFWEHNVPPAPDPDEPVSPPTLTVQTELLARVVLGMQQVGIDRAVLVPQVASLAEQTYRDHLAYVILLGELEGAEAAKNESALLRDKAALRAAERGAPAEIDVELHRVIDDIMQDRLEDEPQLGSLSEDDRQLLIDEMGFLGRLALLPPEMPDQAQRDALLAPLGRTMFVAAGILTWLGILWLAGTALLLVMLVKLLLETWRMRYSTQVGHGTLCLETFALWLVFFFVCREVLGRVIEKSPDLEAYQIELNVVVMFASLLTLFWPVLRGASWRSFRQAIGWHTGGGMAVEASCGLLTHAIAISLALFGLLISAALMMIQEHFSPEAPPPSHPVQDMLAVSGVWSTVMVYVLGSVAAPVMEETVFRGLLFRHLRQATGRGPAWLSFAIAALANSIFFAAIHPQGWTVIPALASLAVGFSVARQWRDSLVACIVAHGVHNAIILTLGKIIFSGA